MVELRSSANQVIYRYTLRDIYYELMSTVLNDSYRWTRYKKHPAKIEKRKTRINLMHQILTTLGDHKATNHVCYKVYL